jgi:hypothetical protein
VCIPAGKSRILRYATLFAPYEGNGLDRGICSVTGEEGFLTLSGKGGNSRFAADPGFSEIKKLEAGETRS